MRLLKFFIACALLPALGSSLHFGVQFFSDASALKTWPWVKVTWFGGGFITWLIVYMSFSRPTRLYILGHELSHAIAVWLSGGKVSKMKIKKRGGHVVANKMSMWIALAPYILPLYPLIVGVSWIISLWFWPHLRHYEWAFLFLWGVVWSFHLCFTFSVMKTDQSDFASQGYFFSFTIIFLCNWWILITLLWMGLGVYGFSEGMLKMWQILAADYTRLGQWSLNVCEQIPILLKKK